jgi:hypothetical protein
MKSVGLRHQFSTIIDVRHQRSRTLPLARSNSRRCRDHTWLWHCISLESNTQNTATDLGRSQHVAGSEAGEHVLQLATAPGSVTALIAALRQLNRRCFLFRNKV